MMICVLVNLNIISCSEGAEAAVHEEGDLAKSSEKIQRPRRLSSLHGLFQQSRLLDLHLQI